MTSIYTPEGMSEHPMIKSSLNLLMKLFPFTVNRSIRNRHIIATIRSMMNAGFANADSSPESMANIQFFKLTPLSLSSYIFTKHKNAIRLHRIMDCSVGECQANIWNDHL